MSTIGKHAQPYHGHLMDRTAGDKGASLNLFPPIEPFDQRVMDVGDGHRIYVEQSGNPAGLPVIVLHGGPGGGSSPMMRRFFDPETYRIILFDQRGCGRSTPLAEVAHNTTWHLVDDIERIRKALGIRRWILFGGSWGATLALIYAITQPERAAYLVLRGVFLMTQRELQWFYGGGAGAFWPELWQKFTEIIPPEEQDDLIAAYHRRLFSGDRATEMKYAQAWTGWENALASVASMGLMHRAPGEYARIFARLECHYFRNGGFLECDGWIERELPSIAHIPASIVQGRLDMICPPQAAWRLSESWPRAEISILSNAGHAMSEPEISRELLRIMRGLRSVGPALDL